MPPSLYLFLKNFWSGLLLSLYRIRGGYTKVNVRGQLIKISVDNWRTLKRAKTYSIKEPDTLDWLDKFESDSCYFDLGANIGQYSLYPVKRYGNKIHVYSFEPQSINYYLLNKNIHLNKLKDNITPYCIAVSGKSEFSKLYIPKFIPGGNRSQFGEADMQKQTNHTQGMFGVTLDDLCSVWNFPIPNYIKIDVDGIEIPIIKGAMNVLGNHAVKSVIVELGTDREQKEAVTLMKQAGLNLKLKTKRNWGETCFVFERS
jgi:FkbM family methyltransferase